MSISAPSTVSNVEFSSGSSFGANSDVTNSSSSSQNKTQNTQTFTSESESESKNQGPRSRVIMR
ncbi:MAG: hypothetical protein KI793_26310 [Rivularia sp. (in: Bacteria)]|nr:hypothetical protein [Rivularia sp. MS3]